MYIKCLSKCSHLYWETKQSSATYFYHLQEGANSIHLFAQKYAQAVCAKNLGTHSSIASYFNRGCKNIELIFAYSIN